MDCWINGLMGVSDVKSARGLAHSTTLCDLWNLAAWGEAFGLRQSSGAFPSHNHDLTGALAPRFVPLSLTPASAVSMFGNSHFGPFGTFDVPCAVQPEGLTESSRWSFGAKGGTTTGIAPGSARTLKGCQKLDNLQRRFGRLIGNPLDISGTPAGVRGLSNAEPVVVPPSPL